MSATTCPKNWRRSSAQCSSSALNVSQGYTSIAARVRDKESAQIYASVMCQWRLYDMPRIVWEKTGARWRELCISVEDAAADATRKKPPEKMQVEQDIEA